MRRDKAASERSKPLPPVQFPAIRPGTSWKEETVIYNAIKTAALISFAALSIALPAAAETISVKVSYAGLDLNSTAGIAEFDRRISRAVKSICSEADRTFVRNEYRRCTREAHASGLTQKDRVIALVRLANDRQQLAAR